MCDREMPVSDTEFVRDLLCPTRDRKHWAPRISPLHPHVMKFKRTEPNTHGFHHCFTRREARGYVGGIVHDSSGTGATIFVEPPAAVEFGNRVRELELEEQREVERVLRELTEQLHPYHDQLIAAFTTEGRLLIFQAKELPELGRGKGNKLINIPSAALKNRTEFLGHVLIFSETDALTVYSGKRHITLTLKELTHYRGERARRGLKLPRGFQKVDRVELKR